jgi:DNA polymerase III alpha subunit
MATIKTVEIEKRLEDIQEYKKNILQEDEELVIYWDTETEGLAYNMLEWEKDKLKVPGRSKELDKIVEFGAVFAKRTKDGRIEEIPELSLRIFFDPNKDRPKSKKRYYKTEPAPYGQENVYEAIHGISNEVLEGKESIKNTEDILEHPATSIHHKLQDNKTTILNVLVDILNEGKEIKAHNSAFDMGMLNAAIKDANEILRLEHNKVVDELISPSKSDLSELKKDLKDELESQKSPTAVSNKELLEDGTEVDRETFIRKQIESKEREIAILKQPPITKTIKTKQTDTLVGYRKHLPIAKQLFLQENKGYGDTSIKISHKQDRMMNIAGIEERGLHGAEEDSRLLMNSDSMIQNEIIKVAELKEKQIRDIEHISKYEFSIPSKQQFYQDVKQGWTISPLDIEGVIVNNIKQMTKKSKEELEGELEIKFQELVNMAIEVTEKLMGDQINSTDTLTQLEQKIFPVDKQGKNKTITIPAKYLTKEQKPYKKQLQEIYRQVSKYEFYKLEDNISKSYIEEVSPLAKEITELRTQNVKDPLNPELVYIRSAASIPMKNADKLKIEQVIGSVKDVAGEIESQYKAGNKKLILMDYNTIVDIYNNKGKISVLKEKYPDLEIGYGFTTLLKQKNNNFSEVNIVLKGNDPEVEFRDLAKIVTKVMDKKSKINNDMLQNPHLTIEEFNKLAKNNNFVVTMGSIGGILKRELDMGGTPEDIANRIEEQLDVQNVIFELHEGMTIFEKNKAIEVLKNIDNVSVVNSRPVLHSEGDEDLHNIRIGALNSGRAYGVDENFIEYQPKREVLEKIDGNKRIGEVKDTEIPETKVEIPNHITTDHKDGWNLELDEELREGYTLTKSQFRDIPKVGELLENLGFDLEQDKTRYTSSDYTLKQKQIAYFIKKTMRGSYNRFKKDGITVEQKAEIYYPRIETELCHLIKADFDGYLLEVDGYLQIVRKLGGKTGPGRGSAAGSYVAYSMEITDIDPIPYGLLFERFYNPERVSLPDIDMDMHMAINISELIKDKTLPKDFLDKVKSDYREPETGEVSKYKKVQVKDLLTKYLRVQYGEKNIKNIQTKGTFQPKSAIDAICKAKGNDEARSIDGSLGVMSGQAYINLASKLKQNFFDTPGSTIEGELESNEELKGLYNSSEQMKEIYDLAIKLEGTHQNKGVHAAGVTKSRTKGERSWIEEMSYDVDGVTTTAIDGKYIEDAEQIKFDFLGLKNLSVIEDTFKIIEATRGKDKRAILSENLDFLKDQKIYKQIQEGKNNGIFQIESDGMKDISKRLKPDTFEDVIAMLALYRPGPLESGMVDDYIERKHGLQEIDYFDPTLEKELKPILEPTNGVIVYQEQVMQIVQTIGGFSLGGADLVRRAMGKKIPEEMDRLKGEFVEGSVKKGYRSEVTSKLFDLIVKFAGYGFNKSHSAAYAVVTMKTAWLKHYYKKEFFTALMRERGGEISKMQEVVSAVKREGITVKTPSITMSGENAELKDSEIYYGLDNIKGTRTNEVRMILESRQKQQFSSIEDLLSREDIKLGKATFEALVEGGALDDLPSGLLSLPFKIPLDIKGSPEKKRAVLIRYHRIRSLSDLSGVSTKEIMEDAVSKLSDKDKKAYEDEYIQREKLSSTAEKEYERLGVLGSSVDYKFQDNKIDLASISEIKEDSDVEGSLMVTNVAKGNNQYGDYFSITVIDSYGTEQKINLTISQMRDKRGTVKVGDPIDVVYSVKYNKDDNKVYKRVKKISIKDENNNFEEREFLTKDDFGLKDINPQHTKGASIKTIEEVKEEWKNSEEGYEHGQSQKKFVFFLKSFKETAKKTGYMLEISDGEERDTIFIGGKIDETLYKGNVNKPIIIEIGKFNPKFTLFAVNSSWGKRTEPKFPGAIAMNNSSVKKNNNFKSTGQPKPPRP